MTFFVWLEHTGLSNWINQSPSVFAYPSILLLHTIGMALLVGINVAIDLRLLGFAPQIPVAEMQKLFPVMWLGLACSAVSGVLLLSAKASRMVVNPAFYVKMGSIALAIAAFFAIRARVFRDPLLEKRPMQSYGKALALVSLTLWTAAITAGRIMAYVGEAAQFGG
jgi:hypothetical protein